MKAYKNMTTLELEQELKDNGCFLNCGGMYCDKEARTKCTCWNEGLKLQQLINERRRGTEYKRDNPQPETVTGRDYEKAILINQEESGLYDV